MQLPEVLDQLKMFLRLQKSGEREPKAKSKHGKEVKTAGVPAGLGATIPSGLGGFKAEPEKPQGKWYSAGGVVCSPEFDRIYIRKPSNNFGPWAFPKGRIDKGESPPKAALREVEEEIGVVAGMVPGGYLGTGDGSMSVTHYYLMVAKRDTGRHDKETEEVKLVPWSEAIQTFARVGNLRDLRITTRALDLVERMRKKGKIP